MFTLPQHTYENRRISAVRPWKRGQWNVLMDEKGSGIINHLWFTFPRGSFDFSRRTLLRIFWDDEEVPSVLAPLGDFFCLPLGLSGEEYRIDSFFVSLAPNNGLNCYFPMPFAKRARAEVFIDTPPAPGGFYFQADYQVCPEGLPQEWREHRFHAQFRLENPTEKYGHNYLVLDAEGSGYLVGASFGLRRRQPQPDAWYHGGGDSIFIDGETNPHILHGIGAEDFFGHSWGVNTYNGLYVGTPYHNRPFPGGQEQDIALYRFMTHDPVRFESSLIFALGAMGDSISSVAYWYQKEPHRPFFTLPSGPDLLPEATVKRLQYDVPLAYVDEWSVYGPIAEQQYRFSETLPLEINEQKADDGVFAAEGPNGTIDEMQVAWQSLSAPRGFLDFNTCLRPRLRTIRLLTGCYAYAVGYVNSEIGQDVVLQVSFDDRCRVRVNNDVVLDQHHPTGFATKKARIHLKKGRNRILVKLSNEDNTTWRAWVFHLSLTDTNGDRLMGMGVSRP